ncbi:MAG: efflux RND transporter permease subunit, partial [Myxococcota bacterium]
MSLEAPRGVLAWWAGHPVAANILVGVLVLGGLLGASRLPQEVFPEVTAELVRITVPYPGASPEEVEQGVLLAIEEAVRGLDGVRQVRSTASEGRASVEVELLSGADLDRALGDVKSAVDGVTSLPEETERPLVRLATNREQVLSLVLYGDVEERALHGFAEEARLSLLAREGLSSVEVGGLVAEEVPQLQGEPSAKGYVVHIG